jgi:hypothetical protein
MWSVSGKGDDAMKTMTPSAEQIEKAVEVFEAAARKGGKEALNGFVESGALNNVNFQSTVLAQGNVLAAAIKSVVKQKLSELVTGIVGRLKRLFIDRTIELNATDGKETLKEASDVFAFGSVGAAKRAVCKATPKTPAVVFEMFKDGTYQQIFGGFGENLKRLCWTEAQIVAFCRDYHDLLRTGGYGTFFLFEGEGGGFLVADVREFNGRLFVCVTPLENELVSSVSIASWCHSCNFKNGSNLLALEE